MKTDTLPKKQDQAAKHPTVYHFHFLDSRNDCCHVCSDSSREHPVQEASRDWTHLAHLKCSHCPLKDAHAAACPAAEDMAKLIEHFSTFKSHDQVRVEVRKGDETHVKITDLQTALAYIFPAIVSHSACPYAPLLKPWVQCGKVFPSLDDVYFMAAAFSSLKKSYDLPSSEMVEGRVADQEPAFLLAMTFHGLLRRIRSVATLDACVNGIIKDIQWAYVALHPSKEIREKLSDFFGSD